MNYNPVFSSNDIDLISAVISQSATYIPGHIGTITESADRSIAGYSSPADTWGTSSNDTHFIHWASGGLHGDFNTNYYENEQLFYTIGDMETISSSYSYVTCSDGISYNCVKSDFDSADHRFFHNRLITETGKGHTYKSYFGVGASADGAPKDGRPMGRTGFFFTSSNGDIIYPSNHYINVGTSKDMLSIIYEGTQNTASAPGMRFQYGHSFDTNPTSSFYTIKVDGSDTDRILRVERPGNRPTTGRK